MSDKIIELYVTKSQGADQKSVERLEKLFNNFLPLMESIEEKGELIKSELKDVSSAFGRYMEKALSDHTTYTQRAQWSDKTPAQKVTSEYPFTRTGLNKYLKNLNAIDLSSESELIQQDVAFIKEIVITLVGYNDRLNALKPLVVAKKSEVVEKQKSAEDMAKKLHNHSDVKFISGKLKDILELRRESLVDTLYAQFKSEQQTKVDYLKSRDFVMTFHLRDKPPLSFQEITSICRETKGYEIINRNQYKFYPADETTLNERAMKSATKVADFMINEYVFKVTDKLAYIIATKDNLKSIDITKMKLHACINATLKLNFKDNSSFDLITSTEYASKPVAEGYYVRVPSRFTNVVKPDGDKLSQPSEKRVQDALTL